MLTRRAVNRAYLERQLLLNRHDMTVQEALRRLAGLQAQTTHSWYLGLWSRLADYRPERTGVLLEEREAVRMALMRSTIHLVTPEDCLWLRPLVEPVIERMTRAVFGRALDGLTRVELEVAARELFAEGEALTFSELGRRLADRWPDRDPASLAQMVRAFVPLVQVPPRGVWGRSGPAAHLPVEQWLGRPVAADAKLETLVLRYLAAFGPATVRDIQHWSGLTRLGEVVQRLLGELVVDRDETGRELYDLPDAPRPSEDTPAPVRFIYEFDNLLRSHADVSRVCTVDYSAHGFTARSGKDPEVVLVDGFVAATWQLAVKRGTATLAIRPFRAFTNAEKHAVLAEAEEMVAFSAPRAKARDVVLERAVAG